MFWSQCAAKYPYAGLNLDMRIVINPRNFNFGDIMVLVSVSASAHHRLVFHVTATNAHIKFILNTDDRE